MSEIVNELKADGADPLHRNAAARIEWLEWALSEAYADSDRLFRIVLDAAAMGGSADDIQKVIADAKLYVSQNS